MFSQILRRLSQSWSVGLLLTLPLIGCAHVPAPQLSQFSQLGLAPAPEMAMTMGERTAPPAALLNYCEREPGECGVDPSTPRTRAVVAKAYWTSVFAARSQPARPATAGVPASSGWGALADQIQASPAAIDPGASSRGDQAVMSDDAFLNTYGGPALQAAAKDGPGKSSAASRFAIPWTPTTRKLVDKINHRVNKALIERSDAETYGQEDYWTEATLSGAGRYADCEDYVLTKKKALIAAGVPARALSMAIVRTSGGAMHAVLVVATDHGDFVLDNLDPFVRPWTDTAYLWVSRQSGDDPFVWRRPAFQPETARRLAALTARAPQPSGPQDGI